MEAVDDMDNSKFKVLLYSDGSHQAFSAAVYTATLLKKIPNMSLTILQVQESDDHSIEAEYSWLELRPKNTRYYWGPPRKNDIMKYLPKPTKYFRKKDSTSSTRQYALIPVFQRR